MEPLEITALSLSALLASLSGDAIENSTVTTHMLPVISGQWQIDLQFTANQSFNDTSTNNADYIIQENEKLSRDIYRALSSTTQEGYDLESSTESQDYTAVEIEETRQLKPMAIASNTSDTHEDKVAINLAETPLSIARHSSKNPLNNPCRELYNFDRDSKVTVSSGKELTWGQYLISYQEEGLPLIAMTTVYDNNEKDCSGNKVDQSGEMRLSYLDYQGSYMRWCSDSDGKKCYAHFNRVYP